MKKNDLIKVLVLLLLTVITYIPTFFWMVDRWTRRDTYYSHGFLIPLVSIFIVWLKRERLKHIKITPSNLGWLFFISGILIHLVSTVWQVSFSSAFSLIFVLIGLVLILLGPEFLKEIGFAIGFLVFMIPLPLLVIANLSFRLKIFAAGISTWLVNFFGVRAIREGSIIKTAHSYIMVEDPCSGIRSLIALIALGALTAYFSHLPRLKKNILFLFSVPIAITTNVIRIVTLSLATEMYGEKFASGLFHDAMGILVFVFAFLGLMFVAKILEA